MSEEGIIKIAEQVDYWKNRYDETFNELQQEKEKNKILELERIPYLEGEIIAYKENTVSKDEIRKIIEDIDNSKPVIAESKLRKLL